MVALLNQVGKTLAKRGEWSLIKKDRSFTAVAAQLQLDPPTDFDRFCENVDLMHVGMRMAMTGPLTASDWVRVVVDNHTHRPGYWMMVGGKINVWPVPTTADSFRYFYMSKNWVKSDDGVGKAAFSADADAPLIPEEILRLHLLWRWKSSKGLDYAEDMATAERETDQAISRDRGPVTVNTARHHTAWPDNFWPSSIVVP